MAFVSVSPFRYSPTWFPFPPQLEKKPDSLTGGGGRDGVAGGWDWLVWTVESEGVDILEGTLEEVEGGLEDVGAAGHALPQLS